MTSIRFNGLARSFTTLGVKRIRRKYIDVTHRDESIAEIVLRDTSERNPINVQFLEELDHVLRSLTEKWSLRAVLIKSCVPGTFSTGLDLNAYASWSDEEVMVVRLKTQDVLEKLMQFPIPTIACIEGVAIGSGAELALCCDFRFGNSNAVFAFPDTRLGLIPSRIAMERLPKFVSLSVAKELIFTGRRIDSAESREVGLLDDCVKHGIEERALQLAQRLQQSAPLALRAAKRAIDNEKDHEQNANLLRLLIAREDRQEGVRALLEKRKPDYKGM